MHTTSSRGDAQSCQSHLVLALPFQGLFGHNCGESKLMVCANWKKNRLSFIETLGTIIVLSHSLPTADHLEQDDTSHYCVIPAGPQPQRWHLASRHLASCPVYGSVLWTGRLRERWSDRSDAQTWLVGSLLSDALTDPRSCTLRH